MWWAELLNNLVALLGSGVAASTSSYESIATVTGTGSSSSLTFSSIPSTYKHLQIRGTMLATVNGYGMAWQANGDGGNNYTYHRLTGDGSATNTSAATAQPYSLFFGFIQGTDTTYPTNFVMDILDYQSTDKYKVVRTLVGEDKNGSGEVGLLSGLWSNTNAINSFTIFGGANFATTTKFALYGVKG